MLAEIMAPAGPLNLGNEAHRAAVIGGAIITCLEIGGVLWTYDRGTLTDGGDWLLIMIRKGLDPLNVILTLFSSGDLSVCHVEISCADDNGDRVALEMNIFGPDYPVIMKLVRELAHLGASIPKGAKSAEAVRALKTGMMPPQ